MRYITGAFWGVIILAATIIVTYGLTATILGGIPVTP